MLLLVGSRLQDGFTALHRSCVTGNIDVIKFLVDAGADVNSEDSVRCGGSAASAATPPPLPRLLHVAP